MTPPSSTSVFEQLFSLLRSGTAQEIAQACSEEWANSIIPGLDKLPGCKHGPGIHLEGDVAVHTGMVVVSMRATTLQRFGRTADDVELIGALIHDIRKPDCRTESASGSVSFPGHEQMAEENCRAVANRLGFSEIDTERLIFMVCRHGDAHRFNKLSSEQRTAIQGSPFASALALIQEADVRGTVLLEPFPIWWEEITAESLSPSFFDASHDRRENNAVKWTTYPDDVLPLWVADMDFRSAPAISAALHRRVDSGDYGYAHASASLRQTLASWCKSSYGWDVDTRHIVPLPGLVCGLNVVARLAGRDSGGSAIVFTPVYPPFLSAPVNQGMVTIQVPLLPEHETDGSFHYRIDFDAFQRAITPTTKLCILCHPHNPSGDAWQREELATLAALCKRNNILLCSDEIHCDLILNGEQHLPTALAAPDASDNLITLMAPSKTFNTPGLGFSFAIIQDQKLRTSFEHAAEGIVPLANIMGLSASEAAFTASSGWLREVRKYIAANRDFAVSYIREHMPQLRTTNPNRTYLLWIDCRGLGITQGTASSFFQNTAKVALNDGATFGAAGEGFVRLNLGTRREVVAEALHRLKAAINTHLSL
jgi:cystathionine beta-lyase